MIDEIKDKKHPLVSLLTNHQEMITITEDMVGDTVSYIPLSGAIIACDYYSQHLAIGFAEWISVKSFNNTLPWTETTAELLELYKNHLIS